MLTLLTATGCRPDAWKICQELMQRQTYKGAVSWIIVDDGEVAQPIEFERENWSLIIVRQEPFWQVGQNTQARNLLAGMSAVEADAKLVIIEDDDCYHAQWLEMVDKWLDKHDLVGEAPAKYYNIKTKRARKLDNRHNASLCCTAMKGAAITAFKRELKHKFIDLHLWKNFTGKTALYPTTMVIGIKGLAGRGGIGVGHKQTFGEPDPKGDILRQWVGVNLDVYG